VLSLPPLSLYVHFPWCTHKCPYCDFNSHVFKEELPEADYIQALLKDLDSEQDYIQGRLITSIYLGGGTPSLFRGASISALLQQIKQRVAITMNAEVSIEANPESVTLEKLNWYQEAGINRISLGIQSLQDAYLKRLGRAHDNIASHRAIKAVTQAGFTNFNIDLMYGLPQQSEQSGLQDIQTALTFNPPHISWYQLTIEPHTAFFKKPPILPHEETLINLQAKGIDHLIKAGFGQYEISAFSQPGFACRHNQNYWEFGDYLGIGAGAHGKITQPSKDIIIRYSKWSNPRTYLSSQHSQETNKIICKKQLPFEFMLNGLRNYQPVIRQHFESRTGLAWETLTSSLKHAESRGLLTWGEQSLRVSPLGRSFYNDLVALFL
jgi:putative oxygen-independent coproporphyrinogen III oxidase